ncbi:alkaline phosphatase family protein [Helicobacter sp. 12S02232-10]|uniref:LTA synthase family protein n=1 Tax=Helicobacter sp. 12S02232-10 TaxID=1476197 RepID=UPI000BA64C40|nr:alkaline phosphatase family protein [Helicobacter sp. 12S02232-10]
MMKILNTLLQSVVFSLFLSLLFICLRIAFILLTPNEALESANFQNILQSLIDGAKYDNRTVATAGIIFFLLAFAFIANRFQKQILLFYAGFIFFICIFLSIANMAFYNIYGSTFDGNLLGIIFDDQKAIFKTGIQGNYHISTKIISLLLASFSTFYIYAKIVNLIQKLASQKICIQHLKIFVLGSFVIFAGIILVFINSHLGFKALSLDQHIHPSKDPFLRKITPGAFRDLYFVYRDYKKITNSKFSDFYDKSPTQAVKDFFNLPQNAKPPFDLSKLLLHTSTNTSEVKIKHIFYIVSESLSEWHFDPEFDAIGLTSGLKSLLDGKHGFKIQNFLENAPGTIKSLDVQITGLFQTDIPINTMIGDLPLFPTAIAGIMQKLGYDTRFYYGGSGIWQKLDRYTSAEGFNKILYNANILDYAKNKPYLKPLENIWGVYDHILFDYIIQNTMDSKHPTFNMIMTTSNHPPYDVNLKAFGVPLEKIKNFLKTHFLNKQRFQEADENVLGHIWWYDKQITHFIKEASKLFPQSLFVITGDHFDRMYPLTKRDNRIIKSIPLILYAPSLTPKQISDIGSHIDIAPSIVELVAPKGFQYDSFGKPLFTNNHTLKFKDDGYALGYFAIATNRFIYTPDFGIQYRNAPPLPKKI